VDIKEKIAAIINEWDPVELLIFCPPDEYKQEIDMVTELWKTTKSLQTFARGIQKIFIYQFDSDIFNRDFSERLVIAKKILTED
jgi:hypothetical protein